MNNLLVIKLRYIGDVLLATPVLHALRGQFPDARITMAVNRGTEDILKGNPDLTDVLIVERGGPVGQVRLLREIRRRKYDCVIDLTDADRSAVMAFCSGAPIRIGFNEEHRWRGAAYSSVVVSSARHRLDRDLDAVWMLGIEPKVLSLVLRTSQEDQHGAVKVLEHVGALDGPSRPLVMLHPGARYWFKAWPCERFAELADRLTEEYGVRVLIGGSVQDRPTAETIKSLARSRPTVVAGLTTLPQFAAMVGRCVLFVGNDNGAMHMAAAMATPVAALFGPSDPAEWGPRSDRAIVLYKGLDCRSCFHPTCRRGEQNCMKQITVDEVWTAVSRLMVPKETVGEHA